VFAHNSLQGESGMKVAIHVNAFPVPSEAFVIEQARALQRYTPVVYARTQLTAQSSILCNSIPQSCLGWRKKSFAIAPGVWAWGGKLAFKDVDVIHAHFGPNGVYALPLAKALGVPLLVTFHGFDATVRNRDLFMHGGMAGRKFLIGRASLFSQAKRVIAVSRFIESRLLTMGALPTAIQQHYIGVDTNRFQPLDESERSLDIVCVGRLMLAKGIDTLISAFAIIHQQFPESRLRLIGAGPDFQVFKDLAGYLGVSDKVIFEGTMAHTEVANIVRQCALSVLASKTGSNGWQEAFGLASIEAAAAGIPSIVTNHGGLPETVVHQETGLIVKENAPKELADAMAVLLRDTQLRRQLGISGRVRVLRDFDLFKQTKLLEDIYTESIE